jgi:hypothetical protein
MVVLPLPAEPCTTMRPEVGRLISSNCRGSISAAMAGRKRSMRRCPLDSIPSLAVRVSPLVAAAAGAAGQGSLTVTLPSRLTLSLDCRVAISRQLPVRLSRAKVPCADATRRSSALTIATVRRASTSPSTMRSPSCSS